MSINFNYPNINASNSNEKIEQIKSYLYQFVDQLNWALSTIESNDTSSNNNDLVREAENTFNSIKGLIIKGVIEEGIKEVPISENAKQLWHYRKWVNGSVECYCINNAKLDITNELGAGLYYGTATQLSYPFEFDDKPITHLNLEYPYQNNAEILMLANTIAATTTTTPKVNIVSVGSKEDVACKITYFLHGKLKNK